VIKIRVFESSGAENNLPLDLGGCLGFVWVVEKFLVMGLPRDVGLGLFSLLLELPTSRPLSANPGSVGEVEENRSSTQDASEGCLILHIK